MGHRVPWRFAAVGLGLALLLALVGQVMLREGAVALGLGSYMAAIAFFAGAVWIVETKAKPAEPEVVMIRGLTPRLALGFASAALLLFAVRRVDHPEQTPVQDLAMLVAWLLSIATFSAGVLWAGRWRPPRFSGLKAWVRAHRIDSMIILLSGGLALGLRLYQVVEHPYPFTGDESSVGIEGWKILTGEKTNLFETGWSGQPNGSFLPTAVSIGLLGKTIFAVRLVSVVEGALTIVTLYLLASEITNRTVASLAAVFLAAFPYHLQFSRLGLNNVMDTLLVTLAL